MMTDKKFYLSWIISAMFMFGLSYLWHGVVLNDTLRLDYPLQTYLTLSAVSYLVIAFLLTFLIYLTKDVKDSYLKTLYMGLGVGLVIYLFAFVFGISFNSLMSYKVIVADAAWQCLEQGAGGIVSGVVYRYVYNFERMLAARANY